MTVKKWTAAQVAQKVIDHEDLFILDVRNADAYEDWKIEGHKFEYVNIPYFELLDGVEEILPKFPADKDVLVVCAKEGSSVMIAEMLSEAGREAAYLEGGMKSWSSYLEPIKVSDLKNGGELYQFVRLGKGCLSYMVISDGEAAIIDAVRFTDVFTNFAKEKGAEIKHVFDTHLHADHISGGRHIAAETGATYYLPPKDAAEVVFEYTPLTDRLNVKIGASQINVNALYSPGHTIGSTSFVIDNQFLLTGDILFIDSIGRPDLAGLAEDWVGDLRETLYSRYRELAEDLVVLPAHFMIIDELNEDGTVARRLGDLFKENHGLNIEDEAEFRRTVTDHLPPQPNAYQQIRHVNMGKMNPDNDEQTEMEIGPNRCAVR
ncbi:glyoxylase-like metal-dependent hydrolase (beta-lactamase superfamily II)/rhodanese-related sulfurtransferase [Cytobacillus eiseniae]|uniref:Glyoxylase-like metal-dependent hydrolase (Beta-lactamase superfamily II)/rhodanese-related sulfurtransferase n=1 Tax=Cytobacillus eiseniae TaxID=762947 RepID=A0ABS4RK57_9BACI|nr:MBL fold metallo-hydrolase [Cytobacillus eiseniae]MBP2243292.1 glyoxylase-like metal-dependent hydrolase (beta-lactamase superfamily II)/rhodanese-related sulfurtransferase [Cytobacillus eiseniae]